jgi:hypothetical protein
VTRGRRDRGEVYGRLMSGRWPDDVYTEPNADPDTLANLGPLRAMAGVWVTEGGIDDHPVVEATETSQYVERNELQPIDPRRTGRSFFTDFDTTPTS